MNGDAEHMISELEVGGRRCRLSVRGDGGPVLLWGNVDRFSDQLAKVGELLPEDDHIIMEFMVDDWSDDFSPWPATIEGQEFGGSGRNVLEWLSRDAVPFVRREFPGSKVAICGYSLSGLFALWCIHESDLFDAAACCSGSLWFDGWREYSETHRPGGKVYLSLGGREPGSGNDHTRSIGECYEAQISLLKKNNIEMRYETNPGGHFSDPAKRMTKAFTWLISELS